MSKKAVPKLLPNSSKNQTSSSVMTKFGDSSSLVPGFFCRQPQK